MDLSITGPKVYFKIRFFGTYINVTQTAVSLLVVTILLITAAYFLGRKLKKRPGRLQVVTEKMVTMLYNMVADTMGKHNLKYAPYIGTLFLSSIIGTLLGMTKLFSSTTADLSVTLAWALVTSVMVWYANIKSFGFKSWLKGFTEPIVVMTPMNIVSEIAQPISLAFRHFGNVAGGGVLTTLIYGALSALSSMVFGSIPGLLGEILGEIPIFTAGIPAFLSIYFDLFSGFVQALVFCLLTMVYVGTASPLPEELKPKKVKKAKN